MIQWENGSTDWVPPSFTKETNILELCNYAVTHGIYLKPVFNWWITTILKRKEQIISKEKSKYWRTNEKFGKELLSSIEPALELDKKNRNDVCFSAIQQEMKNVKLAVREYTKIKSAKGLRKNPRLLPGFQEIKCRVIFDVKIDD